LILDQVSDDSILPGSICRFLEFIDDIRDLWLVFELVEGGDAIFSSVNEIKGSFCSGERIYEIVQNYELMQILEANQCLEFKRVIKQTLEGLAFLQ